MRLCLTLLFIAQVVAVNAQPKHEVWVEARGKIGFLAAHRGSIGHLPSEHAFASEFTYMMRGKGERDWHYRRRNPLYGYTAFFGTAGNRERLGYYLGGIGFVNLPIVKQNRYELAFKIGTGLCYATKVYNSEENILSNALSSHFNAFVQFAFENRFQFGKNAVSFGIDMTHFSNGATKVPNLGLNLPFISLGYSRRIQESNFCVDCPVAGLGTHSWEYGATFIGSSKELFPVGGKRYPVLAMSFFGRKYFNERKRGMEVAFDVISKQAVLDYQPEVPKTQKEIIQMGVFAGYLIPLDHLHMVVGMGAYVRDKYKPEDFLYHRVGLRYVFDNGINANVVLKTHWGRADYIEYGIGYSFKR